MFAVDVSVIPTSAPAMASPRSSAIVAQAERRLQASSYPSHRCLRCSFREGVLTIEGRVSSYYLRQLACALVVNLEGVERVVDRMEVMEPVWAR
ncbi:MAG TPA: BON domain-containing protein [Pirellulales bacterium]|nr:BON domain-containing protein [Pirellulales bacterium]